MISAVILAKDYDQPLKKLIASFKFADEIVIIIDKLFNKLSHTGCVKAKVFTRSLNNDFAAQRNFGLRKAKGDWVLFIDSDEEISQELNKEISQLINNPINQMNGYYIRRQDRLWGKLMTGTEAGRTRILRLVRKGSGKFMRRVHEYYECTGTTGALKNKLIHNPHPTLRKFLVDVNRYSTIHAQENLEEGKKSTLFKIIFYPVGKFLYNWLVLGGCKDGDRGVIVSLIMSLHSFLSWSKLWLMH